MFWLLLAAAAGAMIALQAAANASLRTNLTDVRYAAFFSICGTIITASLVMLFLRPPLPAASAIRSAPWWNWIGGPLGAMIVLAGAALTPRLGAAAFIAAVVAGQVICSLVLDHFGWMDLSQQEITPGRAVGAMLVVGGVLAVRYL
jgi:bacterial/archaeal transporter family-2 protein